MSDSNTPQSLAVVDLSQYQVDSLSADISFERDALVSAVLEEGHRAGTLAVTLDFESGRYGVQHRLRSSDTESVEIEVKCWQIDRDLEAFDSSNGFLPRLLAAAFSTERRCRAFVSARSSRSSTSVVPAIRLPMPFPPNLAGRFTEIAGVTLLKRSDDPANEGIEYSVDVSIEGDSYDFGAIFAVELPLDHGLLSAVASKATEVISFALEKK
ncbi:MAG: hypothetical protein KIT38_09230 [Gemmatimonadaceae bacterium]|nr:hypothetical protein [Gemmatimonadaceae bacterium]